MAQDARQQRQGICALVAANWQRSVVNPQGCPDYGAGQRRRRLLLSLLSLPLLAVRSSRAQVASYKPVASLAELTAPWSAVKFTLPDADGDPLPCIVVRLPDGGWYASSLICTHNKCDIIYVPDPANARNSFDVDVTTPVLACPCHFSVYDLVRHGQVIKGPAPSPPLQLKVEVRDNNVFISR
jgi:nitrite reductase/ring-hydroxylating ferredoxin subunit